MLPRILHPEQLQGYRLSSHDHCRLALLNRPESGGCTVPFHVGGRSISTSGGDVVAVLRSL